MSLTRKITRLAPIADSVARSIYHRPISRAVSQEAAIRDAADLATQGDLDCMQLDILCEMITLRLRNPLSHGLTDTLPKRNRFHGHR